MVMPQSGTLTMAQVQQELGLGSPVDLNTASVRRLACAASTGSVSMQNMYGQAGKFQEATYVGNVQTSQVSSGTQHTFSQASLGTYTDSQKLVILVICMPINTFRVSSVQVAGAGAAFITQGNLTGQSAAWWSFCYVGVYTTATSGNITINLESQVPTTAGMYVDIFQARGRGPSAISYFANMGKAWYHGYNYSTQCILGAYNYTPSGLIIAQTVLSNNYNYLCSTYVYRGADGYIFAQAGDYTGPNMTGIATSGKREFSNAGYGTGYVCQQIYIGSIDSVRYGFLESGYTDQYALGAVSAVWNYPEF